MADVDLLCAGGELGRLIREHDRSRTPLRPLAGWPRSLKTASAILLASPLPIVPLSGPGGIMIYNDAYEDRQRTREAGFDEHRVRPVDLAALTRALGPSR